MSEDELQRTLSIGPTGTPPMGLKMDPKLLHEFLSRSMAERFDRIEQHLTDHEKRLLDYITLSQRSVTKLEEVEKTGKNRVLELEKSVNEIVSSINDQLTVIRKHVMGSQVESLRVNTSVHEVRMELLELAQSQTKTTARNTSMQWGGAAVVINLIIQWVVQYAQQ
jgi:predicted  nucleic acid-binding Zn-ribbon protein